MQCLTDQDCPAPLVCKSTNLCVECDAAHPACPPGTFCNLMDNPEFGGETCIPDCRLDAGVCTPDPAYTFGRSCDFDSGYCTQGCFTDSDCPPDAPVCDGPAQGGGGLCSGCNEFLGLPDAGCPAGEVCAGNYSFTTCVFDCSLDAGPCRPGLCAEDQCVPNACDTNADCVGGA